MKNFNYVFGLILTVILIGGGLYTSDSFAQVNEIEKGKNFDRVLLSTNPDGSQTFQWTSAPERMIDYYENNNELTPVYVDYKTHEDNEKIYFESAKHSLIFDKESNVMESYEGGKLINPQVKMKLTHTIKEAVNGTDNWNPILENETTETDYTILENGIQIISSKGDFKTIYDITQGGFEYTYEYTNNDNSKTNHKYGFTSVCDGVNCDSIEIENEPVSIGEVKGKSDIINKNIKVGNKNLDLKNEQHDYTWSLKHPQKDKMIIDFTHSKGRLNVGDTLTVDPTYSETHDDYCSTNDGGGRGCGTGGNPWYGRSAGTTRHTVEWDVSSIASGSTVSDSDYIRSSSSGGTGNQTCDFYAMATDGSAHTVASEHFDDAGDGTKYVSGASCPNTASSNITSDLGTTADSDIETAIDGDGIFSIGKRNVVEGSNSYSYVRVTSGDPSPTLDLTYTSPPIPLPVPPVNLMCNGLNYSYGCSWTAINATIITGYDIAHSPDNSTWAPGNVTSIGNVTTYDYGIFGIEEFNFIRVNATNVTGNSESSNHVSNTTAGLPDAPSLIGTGISETAINIDRTAGAYDGNMTVTHWDLRHELNDAGGWVSTLTNNTSISFYNHTGLSSDDNLVYQARDRNAVGYSPWSSNATAQTYGPIVATLTIDLGNVGDTYNATGTLNVSSGLPLPVSISLLELIRNGTTVSTSTPADTWNIESKNIIPIWYTITNNNLYEWTLNATLTNGNESIEIASSNSEIQTREYTPSYFVADYSGATETLNYTIVRNANDMSLKMNRDLGGTWKAECLHRTLTQALGNEGGVWNNQTVIGYYQDDRDTANTQNIYIACYNDDLLFTTVSYSNSSNALVLGLSIFDNLGGLFGAPAVMLIILAVGTMATGRTAPTILVILLTVIGIVGALGMLVLETEIWGLLVVAGAIGIFQIRRLF